MSVKAGNTNTLGDFRVRTVGGALLDIESLTRQIYASMAAANHLSKSGDILGAQAIMHDVWRGFEDIRGVCYDVVGRE